jgi:hypothetical protein
MKKIKISIYWPDDWKSVLLTQKEYQSILNGKSLEKEGEGYSYDGEEFQDYWSFEGGIDGNVVVSYNDGGIGFDGSFSECEIEEV